jgi:hypothetical protein
MINTDQITDLNTLISEVGSDLSEDQLRELVPDLSNEEFKRLGKFTLASISKYAATSIDTNDGSYVAYNGIGDLVNDEKGMLFSRFSNQEQKISNDPSALNDLIDINNLPMVVQEVTNELNDGARPTSIHQVNDSRSANEIIEAGGLVKLHRDNNLEYVQNRMLQEGAVVPIEVVIDGERVSLSIVSFPDDKQEDMFVNLQGDNEVNSEHLVLNNKVVLAVNSNGDFFAVKNDDWDFSNNISNDPLPKTIEPIVSKNDIEKDARSMGQAREKKSKLESDLERIKKDEEDRKKGSGGGMPLPSILDFGKRKKRSLEEKIKANRDLNLLTPAALLAAAQAGKENIQNISKNSLPLNSKFNNSHADSLRDNLSQMAEAAEAMSKVDLDLEHPSFKEFKTEFDSLRENMFDLNKDGGTLLHQGQEVTNSDDFKRLSELSDKIANAISNMLGRGK